jgi:hypothetical protein
VETACIFDAVQIFNEGNQLRKNIYEVNMTGVTGPFRYTSDGNLANPAYEIINVIGTGTRRIGYWSNYREFVSQVQSTDTFKGLCIDVFLSAVILLPYVVPYKFVP